MTEVKVDHLIENIDARDWAKCFVESVKENSEIATDVETMITWFSHALMVGYDCALYTSESE